MVGSGLAADSSSPALLSQYGHCLTNKRWGGGEQEVTPEGHRDDSDGMFWEEDAPGRWERLQVTVYHPERSRGDVGGYWENTKHLLQEHQHDQDEPASR